RQPRRAVSDLPAREAQDKQQRQPHQTSRNRVSHAPRRASGSTLSLHDALPIFKLPDRTADTGTRCPSLPVQELNRSAGRHLGNRSEEHTSELQSQSNLVCRLLLEKKKRQSVRSWSSAHWHLA